jgi:DNA repair exonuclease SbcCD ATPase subunit
MTGDLTLRSQLAATRAALRDEMIAYEQEIANLTLALDARGRRLAEAERVMAGYAPAIRYAEAEIKSSQLRRSVLVHTDSCSACGLENQCGELTELLRSVEQTDGDAEAALAEWEISVVRIARLEGQG